MNEIAIRKKIERKKIRIADSLNYDINNNNINDYFLIAELDSGEIKEHLLIIIKDDSKIELLENILPSSILGTENIPFLSLKGNNLVITNHFATARPLSEDYLSFTKYNGSLIVDTVMFSIRDYNVGDKDFPFVIRSRFKTKENFGIKDIYSLKILEKSEEFKNLNYDYSIFNFDNKSFLSIEKEFNTKASLLVSKFQEKDKNWFIQQFGLVKSSNFLAAVPVYSKTLINYNNLGYYLQQLGLNSEAILILNSVLKAYPNRTPAYVNLGDVYWDLKEITKAKEAYNTYISLMKKSGKETKIPKRVYDRVK